MCRVRRPTATISTRANSSADVGGDQEAGGRPDIVQRDQQDRAERGKDRVPEREIEGRGAKGVHRILPRAPGRVRPRYFDEREKQNNATANTIAAPWIVR